MGTDALVWLPKAILPRAQLDLQTRAKVTLVKQQKRIWGNRVPGLLWVMEFRSQEPGASSEQQRL